MAKFSDGSTRDVTRSATFGRLADIATITPGGEVVRERWRRGILSSAISPEVRPVRIAFLPNRPIPHEGHQRE